MEEHRVSLGNTSLRLALQPGVFAPSVASMLLGSKLPPLRALRVCDLTTGCGIHAIMAAKLGARRVDAIDIDANAATVARYNAAINRVERRVTVEVMSFSYLSPTDPYDIVLFNAPQSPTSSNPPADNAVSLVAGRDGADVNIAAVTKAYNILRPGGRVLFTIDAIANPTRVLAHTNRLFDVSILVRHRTAARFFEVSEVERQGRSRAKKSFWIGALDGIPAYEKLVVLGSRRQ